MAIGERELLVEGVLGCVGVSRGSGLSETLGRLELSLRAQGLLREI